MNARQDQYHIDSKRQIAQVDATLSASLGARERIAAAYRAEIQCLNLTLGDFGALKSKVADLEARLSQDESSLKDWQVRKEDELARQEQ